MLKCQNVIKIYYNETYKIRVPAVVDVSFEVKEGKSLSLVGRSGSGKTSLLKMCCGLMRPTTGQIFTDDVNLYKQSADFIADFIKTRVAIIEQNPNGNLFWFLTPYENALFVQKYISKPSSIFSSIDEIFNLLEISELKNRKTTTLSGGELQRLSIALALIKEPHLLVADEPTGNLDHRRSVQFMEILKKIQQEYKLTTILATHNTSVANFMDNKLMLSDGRISEYSSGMNVISVEKTEIQFSDPNRITFSATVLNRLNYPLYFELEIYLNKLILFPLESPIPKRNPNNGVIGVFSQSYCEIPKKLVTFYKISERSKFQTSNDSIMLEVNEHE